LPLTAGRRMPTQFLNESGAVLSYGKRIKNTMRELAAERGFSRVTMDELASRAGISKRTVYRYFRSKEEIIDSVLDDFLSNIGRKIRQAFDSADEPVEKILGVLRAITENIKLIQPTALYDLQRYYPHLWDKIERFRAEKLQQFYVDLLTGDDGRRFRKIDPRIFTAALLASVRSVVNPNFLMENNLSPEETIISLFTIFMYGVLSDESQNRNK